MNYSDKKIVILEKNSVTPSGDICLDSIIDLGNAVVYDSVPEGELYDIVKGAEAVICSKAKFTADILEKCPDLRYIGLWATGYDNINVAAASEKGITVSNVPGYSTDSVAQHTFAMILNLASNSIKYDKSVHDGDWKKAKIFTYLDFPIMEISGYGNIDIKTQGTLNDGQIFGEFNAFNATAKIKGLNAQLTNGNCKLLFNNRDIEFKEIKNDKCKNNIKRQKADNRIQEILRNRLQFKLIT